MFYLTKDFAGAIRTWALRTGQRENIVAAMALHRLGGFSAFASKINEFKDDRDYHQQVMQAATVEALKDRIEFLIQQHDMDEKFLLVALVSSIEDSLKRNLDVIIADTYTQEQHDEKLQEAQKMQRMQKYLFVWQEVTTPLLVRM